MELPALSSGCCLSVSTSEGELSVFCLLSGVLDDIAEVSVFIMCSVADLDFYSELKFTQYFEICKQFPYQNNL